MKKMEKNKSPIIALAFVLALITLLATGCLPQTQTNTNPPPANLGNTNTSGARTEQIDLDQEMNNLDADLNNANSDDFSPNNLSNQELEL